MLVPSCDKDTQMTSNKTEEVQPEEIMSIVNAGNAKSQMYSKDAAIDLHAAHAAEQSRNQQRCLSSNVRLTIHKEQQGSEGCSKTSA